MRKCFIFFILACFVASCDKSSERVETFVFEPGNIHCCGEKNPQWLWNTMKDLAVYYSKDVTPDSIRVMSLGFYETDTMTYVAIAVGKEGLDGTARFFTCKGDWLIKNMSLNLQLHRLYYIDHKFEIVWRQQIYKRN